ncbi:MAG: hypothetical protein ACOH2B_05400 [Burkholderiaceae bacterium]
MLIGESMLVFIDTEFTDFFDPKLISIGMVADSGEEFYAEVPFSDAACSTFVREVVIPLLNQYPHAYCPIPDLGMRIMSWLKIVRRSGEDIVICIDFQTDWKLLAEALDNRVPTWCSVRNVDRNLNEMLRYDFHKKNGLAEHHALHDARAARYSFRERPPVTF